MNSPCSLCGHPLKNEEIRCPSCKHWNFGDEEDGGDTVLLSDAKLSETPRLDIGFLNDVFGGGLAQTSVNLIAGPPGAGKTTLFLQLADIIIEQTQKEVLHIATEQHPAEIKSIAQRIKIKNLDKIRVVKAMAGLKRNMFEMFEQYKPGLIIIDSLTMLCAEDLNLQVQVAADVKRGTLELSCPSLLVNQVNKAEDHAGLMKLQHSVDALFMLDKDDSVGERVFYSMKNRFGPAPKGIILLMTPEDDDTQGKLVPKDDQDDE